MSFNKVLLIGNTGRDPEVRHLESGVAVATFTLATTERYKDRNGVMQDQTEWHNIVCWRNLAELSEKYISKGSQIFVEGKIRTRSWTDQTGQKRFTTEIIADNIRLLGRRADNPAVAGGNNGYANGYGGGMPQQPMGGQPAYQNNMQQQMGAPAYHNGAQQQMGGAYQAYQQPAASQPMVDFPMEDVSDDLPF